MSKNLLKKAKKAAKKVTHSTEEVVSSVKSATSSKAESHIKSLSKQRRDAAVVWGMIKDRNHTQDEIKQIVKDKGFTQLLGEI